MKTTTILGIILLLLVSPQMCQAQVFKKLKEKVVGKKDNVPTEMTSGHDMKFEGWNLGEANIIGISVFSNDFEKYREYVGTIQSDGGFNLTMPNNLKTWVSVSVYGKDCENAGEAVINNPEVKLAWNRLFVFQNETYLGGIMPANPVEAAYNLNNGGINNGRLGKYYLSVYADGDASVTIDCKKKMDMTDGKETTYKNMPVEDKFDLHYKKGWNWVEVHNLNNIWVGLTKHYQERAWRVVDELPQEAVWVFRPAE